MPGIVDAVDRGGGVELGRAQRLAVRHVGVGPGPGDHGVALATLISTSALAES